MELALTLLFGVLVLLLLVCYCIYHVRQLSKELWRMETSLGKLHHKVDALRQGKITVSSDSVKDMVGLSTRVSGRELDMSVKEESAFTKRFGG